MFTMLPPLLLLLLFLLFVNLFRFLEPCFKTAQDFQNELIRKLNIYDLSKWKINYLSISLFDNDHIIFSTHYTKNLSTKRNFAFVHWFSLVLIWRANLRCVINKIGSTKASNRKIITHIDIETGMFTGLRPHQTL